MAGAPIDIPYKITGFELLISNNGKVSTLKSKSANFTPEMKNALNGMGKGSTLNITQIKAAGPSGKEMPIGNLTFVLN